jgi:hypothetical protein
MLNRQPSKLSPAVANDPFVKKFFARIPPKTAASFSEAQLLYLKQKYGSRAWGNHTVDIRFSVPFYQRGFYCVFLLGKERRSSDRLHYERLHHRLWTAANSVLIASFLLLMSTSLIGSLYVLKSEFNIDVIPGLDTLPDAKINNEIDRQLDKLID